MKQVMYLFTFDEGTFGIGKQRQFNEALQVSVIMFRICVNSNFAPIVEETSDFRNLKLGSMWFIELVSLLPSPCDLVVIFTQCG